MTTATRSGLRERLLAFAATSAKLAPITDELTGLLREAAAALTSREAGDRPGLVSDGPAGAFYTCAQCAGTGVTVEYPERPAPPPPVDGSRFADRLRGRERMGRGEADNWTDTGLAAAPVAAAQPAEGVDGPDDPDGCDHEGFPGGCARFGCNAELQQMLDWLAANEGETANLPFLADNLRDEGRPERGDMVRAANTFIDRQEEVIRWLLKHPNPPRQQEQSNER